MTFRTEAVLTAFAIAALGIAKGVSIVLRCLAEAIDAAVALPAAPEDVTVPDLLPDWVDDGSAQW